MRESQGCRSAALTPTPLAPLGAGPAPAALAAGPAPGDPAVASTAAIAAALAAVAPVVVVAAVAAVGSSLELPPRASWVTEMHHCACSFPLHLYSSLLLLLSYSSPPKPSGA